MIDKFEKVTDKDAAVMTRRIPREEGIFAGNSAGSAMAGLMQLKNEFKAGDVVVVIFHDHGTRYLGKMFNEDWMRDRGFLPANATKTALDLVQNHMNQPLVHCKLTDTCDQVFKKMQKFGISQIPVMNDDGQFVGSIEDSHLYSELLKDNSMMDKSVDAVMLKPYPIVAFSESIEKISSMIDKQNSAVLMMDMAGNWHIITKQDVIRAIAEKN